MPLNKVTITGTFDDGSGTALSGTAVFTPSQTVYYNGQPVVSANNPVSVAITGGTLQAVQLVATDNTPVAFLGQTGFWYWTVAITLNGVNQPGFSFFLPSSPSTKDLYALANTNAGGGGTGTVTTVSVVTADGLAGSVANPTTTPAITLSTTVNGVVKGNGTALSAATAGTDYLSPAGGTLTGALAPAEVGLTFGASIPVNAALGNVFAVTLTASTGTLANPTNSVDGQLIRVRVIQGTGGSFTLAYGGNYDFGTAGQPTLSTAVGKVDILGFEYVASLTKWCYIGSGLGF